MTKYSEKWDEIANDEHIDDQFDKMAESEGE
jgi:hypothetical protein